MDIVSIALILITIVILSVIAITCGKSTFKILKVKKLNNKAGKEQTATSEIIDYDVYEMSVIERIAALIIAASVLFLIGYIFYKNIFLAALLTPFSLLYPKIRIKQIIAKRKNELKLQFKDALQSLSSSLYAGKSFEMAMKSAITDLLIQYEPDCYIIKEFEIIVRKLESNDTIEKAFEEFAVRSRIEEIQGFAEVLEICKRAGGNLIMAIKSSTDILSDKIEVLNDIHSILGQKKLEQKILSVMPLALILMLSTSAKDFMMPVFTEISGRIVMTISILLFALAYYISDKITNIEV
jgi:tight adherence protein B